MNSHKLADLLLQLPAMPLATHADNHTAVSDPGYTSMKLGLLNGTHLIIGNYEQDLMQHGNFKVLDTYFDEFKERNPNAKST